LSRRVWNISREGDSTASLGSLGQGSITLRVKKVFLIFSVSAVILWFLHRVLLDGLHPSSITARGRGGPTAPGDASHSSFPPQTGWQPGRRCARDVPGMLPALPHARRLLLLGAGSSQPSLASPGVPGRHTKGGAAGTLLAAGAGIWAGCGSG